MRRCVAGLVIATAAAPAVAQDAGLGDVKAWYGRRSASPGAVLLIGDSRSSWTDNRVPGQIIRNFDVQFARLFFEANAGNSGGGDGMAELQPDLQGMDTSRALTLPGQNTCLSGVVNHFPVSVAEQWSGPSASDLMWINVSTTMTSTAGGSMRPTSGSGGGGTYFRGDPALGRNVSRVRYFAVSDSRPVWLTCWMQMAYGSDFAHPSINAAFGPVQSESATPGITALTADGPNTTGTGIAVRLGWNYSDYNGVAGAFHNKGLAWVGASVEFAGDTGIILAPVAQGGWNTRSHLPATVYAPNDNAYTDISTASGAKYSDESFREWYGKCINVPAALVRVELGKNIASGGAFHEQGGPTGAGAYKANIEHVVQRALTNLAACGVTDVVVELVSYYSSYDDGDNLRTFGCQQALRELAAEHGWALFDQLQHLRDGGYTQPGVPWAIATQYTTDGTHQSFAGIQLLGWLEWTAISNAPVCPRLCTADYDGDGDFGTDFDIQDFFACLGGRCADCEQSDFNGDGDFGTDADIEAFFRVLGGGPC